jgi:hypothetical protein
MGKWPSKNTTEESEPVQHANKKSKKYWRTIPKNIKGDKSVKLIALDPNTYEIVNVFNGIGELEFATNRKHLQALVLKHINNQFGKTGKPLIEGWIIVRITENEMDKMTLEEYEKYILDQALDKIIILQLQRIREHLNSFITTDKHKIHQFLRNVESANPNNINIKIKL